MPFTQVVEPSKVVTCSSKEVLQLGEAILYSAHKGGEQANCLHGRFDNHKTPFGDMLTEEHTSGFPLTRTDASTLQ